ncbi:MAG: hypothetical protein B6226_03885, partial [Candidatus Cloacimonetes bacterium 4572_65]
MSIKKALILILSITYITTILGEYKLPDNKILDVYETKKSPYIISIPFTKNYFQINYDSNIELKELADPTINLAGKKFSTKLNATREFYPTTEFKVIKDGKGEIDIDLSKYKGLRTTYYSHDYSKAIMTNDFEDGVGMILVNFKNGKITEYPNVRLNGSMGDPHVTWFSNNKKVLVRLIPQNRGAIPIQSLVPNSPIIDETHGKVSQLRTYTKLLQSAYDKELFDYYFTSQIALLDLKSGKIKNIGEPGVFSGLALSPNNKKLLINRVLKPYSYSVPYYYFPKEIVVWDLKGKLLKEFVKRPLQDQIPIGGTYTGQRSHHWFDAEDETIVWVEAQDNGNPKVKVPHRDILYKSTFPYTESKEFFRTEHRYYGYETLDNLNWIIFSEYDRDNLWEKEWLMNLKDGSLKLITDRNKKDKYSDRGSFITAWNKNKDRLISTKGDLVFYKNNTGASPDGNRPYLASFNLKTGEFIKLYESEKDAYEQIINFADKDLNQIILAVQNQEIPRNYFLVDLSTKERETLTSYQDPYPDYAHLKKELVTYKRSDGVDLSAVLYLPHDYVEGDKLPLIIKAYPREYTSKATAGQVSGTDKTFTWYYGDNIKYLAMSGYALLYNASIPIVGDPQTVNDTFLDQLKDGVSSAISYMDSRGIIDPERVGIIGHSYGAFMVANILANSDICKVGVAKSGAYN